jgi:twinkle protein
MLDHISILVGMQQAKTYGNEREAIDECMHKLRSLVESTGVTILLISHLSRAVGGATAHEEGGRATLGQLRGSQAIAQLSNIAIAIERDSQADTEELRSTSVCRVLKNRFTGETGEACTLKYIRDTATLVECDPIKTEDAL